MLRFRFELRPIRAIQPWGRERPELHWFALTDGWYWIEAGDHELLRYSESTLERWQREGPDSAITRPYVDYYVVRLWEDVLAIQAHAMKPVPEDLVNFLTADPADEPEPPDTEECDAALEWRGSHHLYMGPLRNAPELSFRRTVGPGGDTVTLTWRHRPAPDVEFAAPATGEVTVPTDAFLAAVASFDHDLITAMDLRVTELETQGPPPGTSLDLLHLRQEHQDRATWLRRARNRAAATDWDAVREGVRQLRSTNQPQLPGRPTRANS